MEMTISPQIKPLLKSLDLPLFAQQLQTYWSREQREREAYYDWLTEDKKAEFINGEIIVHSPAKKRHTDASINLTTLLDTYVNQHNLGFVGGETVLITLTRNDYLPGICFFSKEKSTHLEDDQMKFPAPDFVAEILSPSTEKTDRELKFKDYAAHGVAEYWLVDPINQTVEQYLLQDGVYHLLLKVKEGEIRNHVIAGFTMPVQAIFDKQQKNQALAQILAVQP